MMFNNILSAKLQFNVRVVIAYQQNLFSPSASALIARLLIRDPSLRLGAGFADAEEVKMQPFFEGMDWAALERKEIPPPWKPTLINETDTSYFNKKYTYADIDEATPPVGEDTEGEL